MPHSQYLKNAALFVHDESDENGEPRRVAIQPDPSVAGVTPKLVVLFSTIDTPAQRRAVWHLDSSCVNCGAFLESPDKAGVVVTDCGPRLACRHICFAKAMTKHHPLLSLSAAIRRAAEASR